MSRKSLTPASKMQLDHYLVRMGHFASRAQAVHAIRAGQIEIGGQPYLRIAAGLGRGMTLLYNVHTRNMYRVAG